MWRVETVECGTQRTPWRDLWIISSGSEGQRIGRSRPLIHHKRLHFRLYCHHRQRGVVNPPVSGVTPDSGCIGKTKTQEPRIDVSFPFQILKETLCWYITVKSTKHFQAIGLPHVAVPRSHSIVGNELPFCDTSLVVVSQSAFNRIMLPFFSWYRNAIDSLGGR